MSYLDKPRIGFFGRDATTNPSTGNNENIVHLLDYDNVELLNPPHLAGGDLKEMSDVAYREWMSTLITYDHNQAAPDSNIEPQWEPGIPGWWNYYGDHLTTFGTASVNGVWLTGHEAPLTTDPLVGARVAFDAKLVDVDPADTFSSQLISAAFSLVGEAGGELTQVLTGMPTTAHLRWTNFNRPMGAGTFQCVIPNETLGFSNAALAESPALTMLRDGAAAGGGLVLRYCLYAMQAAKKMAEMYDQFQQGEIPSWNPKVGFVLGSIGVWNGTDMMNAPVGRILQQPGWPVPQPRAQEPEPPHVASHGDVERLHTPGTDANALLASLPDKTLMGPAVAVVQDDVIMLDLLTTFSEQSPGNQAKVDYGQVRLVLRDRAGELDLGVVPYQQAVYEAQAGVVELPLAADVRDRVAKGTLVLHDSKGQDLLSEIPVLQVESDDRGVYLDMERGPDDRPVARGAVRVRAFDKGEPAAEPFELLVQVVADDMHVGVANSVDPLVVQANILHWKVVDELVVHVPAGGVADVPIETSVPGCRKLRFVPPGYVPSDPPQFAVELYSNFRVLPYHDYSHLPDEQITWDFVYDEVFKYYGILYPIMSLIIPWGPDTLPNDPERVAQFAAIMRQAVDRKYLGTALSMPITRELDEGKRRLIQRWCDLQPRPKPASPGPAG